MLSSMISLCWLLCTGLEDFALRENVPAPRAVRAATSNISVWREVGEDKMTFIINWGGKGLHCDEMTDFCPWDVPYC